MYTLAIGYMDALCRFTRVGPTWGLKDVAVYGVTNVEWCNRNVVSDQNLSYFSCVGM